jgi:hypothetical protein
MNKKQGIPIGMLKSVSPAKLVVAGDTSQFSDFQVGGMIVIPAPDYEVMGVVTNISVVNDVAAHFTQSPLASGSQAPVDIDVCVVGTIAGGKPAYTIPPRPPLALNQVLSPNGKVAGFTSSPQYLRLLFVGSHELQTADILEAHLQYLKAIRKIENAWLLGAGELAALFIEQQARLMPVIRVLSAQIEGE